jgi:hypothetical protein
VQFVLMKRWFATAIPVIDGTQPYQQIPFQFSLHIVRSPGAKSEHHSFLAEGPGDPRTPFMQHLKATSQTQTDSTRQIVQATQWAWAMIRNFSPTGQSSKQGKIDKLATCSPQA